MDDLSFAHLREEVFRLHAAGRHAEALALLEREAVRFPDRWRETLYWQGCLAARAGDLDGALRFLKKAVERGHWWAEASLRGDPDLEALQGKAEFEALVSVCRQCRAEAEAGAKPELLVLSSRKDPPWPLLIALHGAGGRAEGFAEHWRRATADGWLVAVPQSSQVVASGGYGWGDHDRAAREIQACYEAMVRDYPVDLSRVVIAGFSQGGGQAMLMALFGLLPVRGVMSVAYAPGDSAKVRAAVADASARGIRLYLVVGEKDQYFDRTRRFYETAKSAGMAVHLEVRPGLGHELPHDFDRTLIAGLEFLVG